jgi:hypothetical protein
MRGVNVVVSRETSLNTRTERFILGYIQKFSDWADNEIYAYNNKHSLRSNTKGQGSKTH